MLETSNQLRADGRDIRAALRAILSSSLFLDADQITPESRLIGDLGADSLDFVDLLFKIEKAFGVEFRHGEFDFFSALDSSSRNLSRDGWLTQESIAKLVEFLPALNELADPERVTPGQLFNLLTVESLVFMVERSLKS